MKFSPNEFWNLTLKEAELIVQGDKERREDEFMIRVHAHTNAIGLTMGGKGFKFQNPFESKQEQGKPKKSREELLAELERAKKRFNRE